MSKQKIATDLSKIVSSIRISNAIKAEDIQYHSLTSASYKKKQEELQHRIYNVLNHIHYKLNNKRLHGKEDAEVFNQIVESIDTCLERVDTNIDKLKGLDNKDHIKIVNKKRKTSLNSMNNNQINKPQIHFKRKIDNYTAFKPVLKSKPNALIPLDNDLIYNDQLDQHANQLSASPKLSAELNQHLDKLGIQKDGTDTYHPYQYEINNIKYLDEHLLMNKEELYWDISTKDVIWITNIDELDELSSILCQQKEIAIDLEHHSYHSYQGITCLMQISTRTNDYIIDTLKLRESLSILNTSFTDPKIVKVLHGADMDIIWLQRDLGLYIVNMFDTGQCARILELPSYGLAYLLTYYCDIKANKKYQLADWRIRPIPKEMLFYAQMDTHYLLYIYDRLKNEILSQTNGNTLLLKMLSKSNDICLKTYKLEPITNTSHIYLIERKNLMYTNRQMKALQLLYQWRDTLARKEDESTGYILPNAKLLNICTHMPSNKQELYQLCSPVSSIIMKYTNKILELLDQATIPNESPLVQPQNINENNQLNTSDINHSNNKLITMSPLISVASKKNANNQQLSNLFDTNVKHHEQQQVNNSLQIITTTQENQSKLATTLAYEASFNNLTNSSCIIQCKEIQTITASNRKRKNVSLLKNENLQQVLQKNNPIVSSINLNSNEKPIQQQQLVVEEEEEEEEDKNGDTVNAIRTLSGKIFTGKKNKKLKVNNEQIEAFNYQEIIPQHTNVLKTLKAQQYKPFQNDEEVSKKRKIQKKIQKKKKKKI